MSPVGLSKRLKITKKEAEVMINKYFNRYRGIKRYLDRAGQEAVRNRYSVTASGRRRYYNMPAFDHPDRKIIQGSIERQGMNAGIQGSNADTIKESMILLVQRLEGYDARLLLTVHDEVVVEAREDIVNEIAPIVSQSLIDGFGKYFSLIPMESSTLIGPCWLKGACEERLPSGKKCDNLEMKFVEDSKYGSKLVCNSCGAPQE
jgi:DNA polymerase-1